MKRKLSSCLLIAACWLSLSAQPYARVAVYPVGFYNLENLYHPLSTDSLRDVEFSPKGSYEWTMDKYRRKLENLSFVLNDVAVEFGGLAVVGVSEIGNRQVLEDLIATDPLRDRPLKIVHHQSPDWRGVDVGLLYDSTRFSLRSSRSFPFPYGEGRSEGVTDSTFRTRDVLLVEGKMAGEPIAFLVNHWPSRRGDKSARSRELAASVVKHVYDSLMLDNPARHVIIMGDLNDNPDDLSCARILDAKKQPGEVKRGGLYNPMWEKYARGIGSLCYQGKWHLFDQIIISYNLLGSDFSTLKFRKAQVYNRDFLIQKTGKNKGYPLRTFSGTYFQNGFSDHFPTYIFLVKYTSEVL